MLESMPGKETCILELRIFITMGVSEGSKSHFFFDSGDWPMSLHSLMEVPDPDIISFGSSISGCGSLVTS